MKSVDHSYEQALIMHDNVHIHVIMNIIVTPTLVRPVVDPSDTMDPVVDPSEISNVGYHLDLTETQARRDTTNEGALL